MHRLLQFQLDVHIFLDRLYYDNMYSVEQVLNLLAGISGDIVAVELSEGA